MHLSEIASQAPGRNAVIMSDGSRARTFAELDRRSLQVSRLLSGLGVQPGGHVALMMANRPEYFEIGWGAQRRGTLWTPVNWHLTAQEAQYIVEDCGALAGELLAHCRSRLASYKCPRTIEFVGELPRLPTGKLLRRYLRDQRQPV